jgi:hypothetical protein
MLPGPEIMADEGTRNGCAIMAGIVIALLGIGWLVQALVLHVNP